jgi:hypothetical protein
LLDWIIDDTLQPGRSKIGSAIEDEAIAFLRRFTDSLPLKRVTADERRESQALAARVADFIKNQFRVQHWKKRPPFRGCGFIEACNGDLLADDATLFEFKSVNRLFRATDFRQILTYLALNHAAVTYPLREVCLANPLQGVSFRVSTTELIAGMTERRPSDVLEDIVAFISAQVTSN